MRESSTSLMFTKIKRKKPNVAKLNIKGDIMTFDEIVKVIDGLVALYKLDNPSIISSLNMVVEDFILNTPMDGESRKVIYNDLKPFTSTVNKLYKL